MHTDTGIEPVPGCSVVKEVGSELLAKCDFGFLSPVQVEFLFIGSICWVKIEQQCLCRFQRWNGLSLKSSVAVCLVLTLSKLSIPKRAEDVKTNVALGLNLESLISATWYFGIDLIFTGMSNGVTDNVTAAHRLAGALLLFFFLAFKNRVCMLLLVNSKLSRWIDAPRCDQNTAVSPQLKLWPTTSPFILTGTITLNLLTCLVS